jgi:hypothetical protein
MQAEGKRASAPAPVAIIKANRLAMRRMPPPDCRKLDSNFHSSWQKYPTGEAGFLQARAGV